MRVRAVDPIQRQWLLIVLPLSAVPLGLVLALGFSVWPAIALSIGGVGIAMLNYRALKSRRAQS